MMADNDPSESRTLLSLCVSSDGGVLVATFVTEDKVPQQRKAPGWGGAIKV